MTYGKCAGCLLLAAFAGIVLPARGAASEVAPRLSGLVNEARLIVDGRVERITPYADGRVVLAELRLEKVLAGRLAEGTQRVSIVEMRELPTPPVFAAADRGVVFLKAAPRSTFLVETLPPAAYYQPAGDSAFLEAQSDEEQKAIREIVQRLLDASRKPETDRAKQATATRAFIFDLIAARHPLLVEDGVASLADVSNLSSTLTDEEKRRLENALGRSDLPLPTRTALIEAVAEIGLRQLVPALQKIESPPELLEASWKALDALGAAPSEKLLAERLAAADPPVRAAAVRELLRREGPDAVSRVAPIALQDPDEAVRIAAIDALGALESPQALPPLERVFAENEGKLRQAAARAIWTIGGAAAADTLARLAFNAPAGGQRHALMLLILMVGKTDARVTRIAQTHPDVSLRKFIEHGPDIHKH